MMVTTKDVIVMTVTAIILMTICVLTCICGK